MTDLFLHVRAAAGSSGRPLPPQNERTPGEDENLLLSSSCLRGLLLYRWCRARSAKVRVVAHEYSYVRGLGGELPCVVYQGVRRGLTTFLADLLLADGRLGSATEEQAEERALALRGLKRLHALDNCNHLRGEGEASELGQAMKPLDDDDLRHAAECVRETYLHRGAGDSSGPEGGQIAFGASLLPLVLSVLGTIAAAGEPCTETLRQVNSEWRSWSSSASSVNDNSAKMKKEPRRDVGGDYVATLLLTVTPEGGVPAVGGRGPGRGSAETSEAAGAGHGGGGAGRSGSGTGRDANTSQVERRKKHWNAFFATATVATIAAIVMQT